MSQFRQLAAILLLLSQALLFISCDGRADGNVTDTVASNSTSENTNGVKTNVEELSLLINIPYEAEDIFWKEDKAQKKLTAVLRFDKADTHKLIADLEKTGTAADSTIEADDWFPDELRSQSEMRGDTALKGKSYSASLFYSEPYTNGTITRIDGTDFFVLELTAK
jgi:hypothetical protein